MLSWFVVSLDGGCVWEEKCFRLDFAGLKQLCRIDFSRKSNCTEMCFVLHLRSSWALFRKDLQSKRLWIIPVWRPHCVQCAEYQSVGHWCAMLSGRESSVLCVVESTLCCVAGHWAGSSGAVQADLPSWKLPASRQLLPTSPTCIPLSHNCPQFCPIQLSTAYLSTAQCSHSTIFRFITHIFILFAEDIKLKLFVKNSSVTEGKLFRFFLHLAPNHPPTPT